MKYLHAQAAAAGDRLPQAGAADGPQDRGADLQPAAVLAPARGGGHRHHRPLQGLLHDGLGPQGGHRGRCQVDNFSGIENTKQIHDLQIITTNKEGLKY